MKHGIFIGTWDQWFTADQWKLGQQLERPPALAYPSELRLWAERVDKRSVVITLNRTILDLVGNHDGCLWNYSEVYYFDNNKVKPITDKWNPDWMSHFVFGDLIDRHF